MVMLKHSLYREQLKGSVNKMEKEENDFEEED